MGRITLYGWYQYDQTLFDGIMLPVGITKELIVNEIIKRSGDLYTYYQHPARLKTNIKNWFETQYPNFDQITRSLLKTYEPLDNYDRTEEVTRKYTNSGSDSAATTLGTEVTTTLGTAVVNEHTGDQIDAEEKTAYDVNTFTPTVKNTKDFNDAITTTNTGTDKVNNSGTDSTTTTYGAVRDEIETLHVFGNVGVTPNSRVLDEEIVLRIKYNIYEIIASMFESEFLIQIY